MVDKKESPVAHLIRSSRQAAGLSQKQLADELGYTSSQFVSNWERGVSSPPFDKLEELCDLLKISPRQIIECIMVETENNLRSQFTKPPRASRAAR